MRATAKQYAEAWYEKLMDADPKEWDQLSANMLKLIHQNGMMRSLPEITRLFEAQQLKDKKITPVTIKSAHAVDDAVITEQLKIVLPNTDVQIKKEIDTSIIGGIQIETENKRWDFSLRGQLRSLSKTIND